MKIPGTILLVCLVLLGPVAAGSEAAEVRPLEFLRALQEKGYHDVAIEYLKALQQQPDVQPEVAAVWDLEMSKSLRGEANRAKDYNPKDFELLMDEAQKHLDKFLKDNPDHPEAVTAMVSSGTFSVDRALAHLRAAKALTDKADKAKHLTTARALLGEAGPRLAKAVETLRNRLVDTPAPEVKPGRRPDAETRQAISRRYQLEQGLVDAQFQAAMADYYTAQTYDDPKAEARLNALRSAAKQMDNIYQAYRITAQLQVNVIGLYAHMWHGKIADELGDVQLARDIYEEVLANEPGPKAPPDKVLDPLFAQVQQFYFAIIARKEPERFLEEATTWLKDYDRKSRYTEGYQGIALEVAKAKIALAGQGKGAERNKLLSEATAILNDMIRVPSPYRQEAVALRQQHSKAAAANIQEVKTFEEAEALAQAAGAASQWTEAVQGFQRALELSDKVKDEKRLQQTRDALAYAKYMVAGQLFLENKLEECLASVGKIVQEHKEAPAAALAGSLAVQAALNLYAMVPANEPEKRQAALERLEKIARTTESTWAGKPAADDARMALAQANLVRGNVAEALEVFEKVNPLSERYPLALYLAARTYWTLYLTDKSRGGGGDQEKLAAARAKAVQRATDSLARFRKAAEPNAPLTPQHVESQLLVAFMHMEAKEFQEAAALLQPLVNQVKAAQPKALDETTVRIFRAALQTYLALNDVAKASDAAVVLADLGADDPAVNGVLVVFARLLDEQRKEAEAQVTRAGAAGDQKAAQSAAANLKSTQSLIGNLLKKLAGRKNHSVPDLVVLGDVCNNVGMGAEATKLYQRVLAAPPADAQADPRGAEQLKAAVTRARAQIIGLLRQAGNFDEAVSQAEKLVEENPRALEPQMELGRCLQARAEKDPTRYGEAVAQWTKIRNWLFNLRRKPPEYYEVIYNSAWCLYAQAYQTGEQIQERVTQAIQLLKSAKVLNEKLSGPDMVAKYDALLEALQKYLQQSGGAAPAAQAPKQ